jgi:hypothetical protein
MRYPNIFDVLKVKYNIAIFLTIVVYLPYRTCIPSRSSSGSSKSDCKPWYHGDISAPPTDEWARPSECPNSCAATVYKLVPMIA